MRTTTTALTAWLLPLLALLVGGAVLVFVLSRPHADGVAPLLYTLRENFNDRVEAIADVQVLSPLVVTVYERASHGRDNLFTTFVAPTAEQQYIDLAYNERLVVVKPQNWMVYTNNGINFYLVSNNVSNRTAHCDLDQQLVALDFRLLTVDEAPDTKDQTGRFKVACVNYTFDNLVRLFGVEANRTYLDLSAYFDKTKNPDAPPVVVDEVVNYLLRHGLV